MRSHIGTGAGSGIGRASHAGKVMLLTCAVAFASPARAWNNFGHQVVAARAYDGLTPKTRARVAALLKLNPQYESFISGTTVKDRDKVAFMRAATWADTIKQREDYRDDNETTKGPEAVGYADHWRHRHWHYYDTPFSPDGTALRRPSAVNAKTQIELLRKTLASPSTSDEVKSYDLVWLLHLVGDIHQPLHAVSRYTADLPDGDRGGNRVLLPCSGRACTGLHRPELHALWDGLLGSSNDPQVAIKRAAKTKGRAVIPQANPELANIDDVSAWIAESVAAAKEHVYVEPIGLGSGPFKPDAAYRVQARIVAQERVALAAARLAHLLNKALGQ